MNKGLEIIIGSEISKRFWARVQPRDIIALVVLIIIFVLIGMGKDGWLQGVGAVIIGYYFSKRVYEENNRKK